MSNAIAPRPPADVMRLARMGCFHPTRLSFVRVMLRRLAAEGWRAERTLWQIDAGGVGRAVYTVHGPERSYSLVCYAHDLPDHMRSDRVIAEAWDATFALFDGVPDTADLDRLEAQVPLQEAGRLSERELVLLRANRSVRLYESVIASLAAGRQPDAVDLARVGYLMRTTGVYGSGKFGMADRAVIADRPELAPPYQAEMLAVWLCRAFTVDLVEHLATARGGAVAVRLAPDLRRMLGVGNATGLGMAPYLIHHPVLINNWFRCGEPRGIRRGDRPGAGPCRGLAVGPSGAGSQACRPYARLGDDRGPCRRRRARRAACLGPAVDLGAGGAEHRGAGDAVVADAGAARGAGR